MSINFLRRIVFFIRIIILAVIITGCERGEPVFSGEKAFELLISQCDFGPRNPGSTGYQSCKQFLFSYLDSYVDTVFYQPFTLVDPKEGIEYKLNNIIARINPDAKVQILLGAHWDTRPWADQDKDKAKVDKPIIGANDGASGVAVLLEIVRLIHENPIELGITVVLFDGEDLGISGNINSYAKGSQYFSKHLPIPKPNYGIILDMVGDAQLSLPIERNSYNQNKALVKQLWQEAGKLNLPAFKKYLGYTIFDDHVPLFQYAGIPAVDIIDFEYPNKYSNYWHTSNDVPEHCSPESLEQVGKLLIHHIYNQESR